MADSVGSLKGFLFIFINFYFSSGGRIFKHLLPFALKCTFEQTCKAQKVTKGPAFPVFQNDCQLRGIFQLMRIPCKSRLGFSSLGSIRSRKAAEEGKGFPRETCEEKPEEILRLFRNDETK